MWDTAGQEAYMALTRQYYRNTDGCIMVYDITNRESFEHLPRWLSEVREDRAGVVANARALTLVAGG
eukprot:scaffold7116_cov296-Pinguiococcus_pyrenoidosus.AAC.8